MIEKPCGSSSIAAPVTLTLGSAVGENVITIQTTVNDSLTDTTTTIYSGTIEVELTILEDSITNDLIATRYPVSLVLPLDSPVSDGDETLTLVTDTTGTGTASGNLLEFTHTFFE